MPRRSANADRVGYRQEKDQEAEDLKACQRLLRQLCLPLKRLFKTPTKLKTERRQKMMLRARRGGGSRVGPAAAALEQRHARRSIATQACEGEEEEEEGE